MDQPASKEAKKALEFAKQQLGKPYILGAEGPSAFDCSGLTQDSYSHAGVSIPRTSQTQWEAPFEKVKWGEWAVGDLIFSYPDEGGVPGPGHVTMYAGGMTTIEAPHTGDVVKIVPVSEFESVYVGSNRPVPAPKPLVWTVKNGKGGVLGKTKRPAAWAIRHPRAFRTYERVTFVR